MTNEVYWQGKITDSIRKQGGAGKKWASQWLVGPPDLVLGVPSLGGVLMEVKLLKDVKEGFVRSKMGPTPIQHEFMHSFVDADVPCVCGLVITKHSVYKRAILHVLPWNVVGYNDSMIEAGLRDETAVAWVNGVGFNVVSAVANRLFAERVITERQWMRVLQRVCT